MVSSDDSIIVGLKNSIVNKINTLIGNHNSSNTAHSDIRNSIPSKTSDLTNDSGYLTSHQDISGKANINDLGSVAFSNDYTDLDNTPTIPSDVSELTDTNNTSFTPNTHTHGNLQNDGSIGTSNNINKNVVTDGNGKITTEAKPTIPSASTTVPSVDSTNGSYGSGTTYARADHQHPKSSLYAEANHNHNSTYLAFNDGETFTALTDVYGLVESNSLSSVATSGSYNDLSNKPTIPTQITVDNTVTSNSNNPVKSSGIYSALAEKQDEISQLDNIIDKYGISIFDDDGFSFYGMANQIYYDYVNTNELHFINSNGDDICFDDIILEGDNRLTNARTPTSHTHSISDVTNLQTTLNGKANSTHSHSISEVTSLQSSLNNKVEESDLLDLIYPIGSIYMEKSTSSRVVCPIQQTLGGTWTRIENRFLLASEGGQGTGTTGGEAAHTLTEDEMPSHTHIQNSHNHTQNAHHHGTGHATYNQFLATNVNVALAQTKRVLPSEGSNYYYAYSTEKGNIQEVNNTANTTATNQAQTATNQNTGGGQAHNNMPPYIIVNVWERTA